MRWFAFFLSVGVVLVDEAVASSSVGVLTSGSLIANGCYEMWLAFLSAGFFPEP
jgi:hypothetical protein